MPVSAWVTPRQASQHDLSAIQRFDGTLERADWAVIKIWPKVQDPAAPNHVPPPIGRAFAQAENAAARKDYELAGMGYRRTLELAVKDCSSDLEVAPRNLYEKLESLSKTGALTRQMTEWAHIVRTIGNGSAHDQGEPSSNDIEDLAAFTRVFLEYVYTLPEKVRQRSKT